MPCSLGVPGCGQQVAETEPAGAGLHKCTKCRRVAYCCKTCQVEAWRSGHKQECKALQARGAGAGLRDAQETVRAALTGKTDRRVVAQQQRVFYKMVDLFDAGNYAQVEEMAEEGLAVAETMLSSSQLPGAPGIVARIYRMVGHSYSERCDHIKGLRLLEQARELAVQVGDRPLLARVYHCLGCLRQRTGEYEEAIEMDEQVRIIAVEHGLHEDEGVACSSLGVNYELMMQYEKAMKYYEESVAIHGSHRGQRLQQASARSNIGRLLFKQGQRRKAVACMKQAWDVAMEEDNASLKASSSVLLGKGLWLQVRDGDLEADPDAADHEDCPTERADTMQEAETWLRTAMDLATEHNFLSYRQTAQMDLAFLTFVQGKEGVAVDLVTQHLQGFVDMGRNRCASCFQLRGDDAPMLTCDGCRVVRYCNAEHQKTAWKGSTFDLSNCKRHKDVCPLLKRWRRGFALMEKNKGTLGLQEILGLREDIKEFLKTKTRRCRAQMTDSNDDAREGPGHELPAPPESSNGGSRPKLWWDSAP